MTRQLKARKPDMGTITRPKVMLFGPPAVGKTWVSLEFPHVYFIDTEGGASLPQYQRKLDVSGGVYFGREHGSQDFNTVIQEIQTLATVQHDYLTLVIDSFSKLYLLAAAEAENRVGNSYGADRKEANKPTRQLMTWLDRLDMNVVLICHSKEKWGRKGDKLFTEGQTFDGWDKLEYDLHLCLQITRDGAHVHKTRLEGFPRDENFPWTFAEFERRAGKAIMLRPVKPIVLPEAAEVNDIRQLLHEANMKAGWEQEVFHKAGVSSWEEMDREKVQACIKYVRGIADAKKKAETTEPKPEPIAPDPAAEKERLRGLFLPRLRKAAESGRDEYLAFSSTMPPAAKTACGDDLISIEQEFLRGEHATLAG